MHEIVQPMKTALEQWREIVMLTALLGQAHRDSQLKKSPYDFRSI